MKIVKAVKYEKWTLGHVVANREDLKRYFPKEIWERLPVGDNTYAFGDWVVQDVGCPIWQAFVGRERYGKFEAFDEACEKLALRESATPAIPIPKSGDPIPVGGGKT